MAAAKSATHLSAASDVATAERAAAHVGATEATSDVTTATEAAAPTACESAGSRQRERCCEKCDQGEFLDHDVHPSFRGRPGAHVCARPPNGSGITPC